MIPYGRQEISQADVEAVTEVLHSDFLTQGPQVPAFEQVVCATTSAKFAVAVCNATAALHLACLALEVGPGDIVWTSPITFVASANCALYCGARVDFVDVEAQSGNMSVVALAAKLADAEVAGCLPKVIIPVHLAGHSCDMAAIAALARRYHVRIIEDASHGIGGDYHGYPVGSCQYADITVFSFHPVKIITTAEGGMALTNHAELANRMEQLRSHGIIRDSARMQRPDEGGWYYEQHALGFNYRMTEMQAALGRSQLQRLATFVARRNQLAQQYADALQTVPVTIVEPLPESHSSRHLYLVRLHQPALRRQTFDSMRAQGIQVHVHYFPVHLQPYYQQHFGFNTGDFPAAEQFYQSLLTLPLYPGLQDADVSRVSKALSACLTV